jgi:hypothetical protein
VSSQSSEPARTKFAVQRSSTDGGRVSLARTALPSKRWIQQLNSLADKLNEIGHAKWSPFTSLHPGAACADERVVHDLLMIG